MNREQRRKRQRQLRQLRRKQEKQRQEPMAVLERMSNALVLTFCRKGSEADVVQAAVRVIEEWDYNEETDYVGQVSFLMQPGVVEVVGLDRVMVGVVGDEVMRDERAVEWGIPGAELLDERDRM